MAATTTPLALPSAGGERPRHVLSLATLFVGAGVLVAYAALVGTYVLLRPEKGFPPEGVELDQYLGNMLLITMALAAFTVEWGYASVRRGLVRQASTALGVTVGLGVSFLALLAHTFTQAGYGPASHPYGTVVSAMALGCAVLVALATAFTALTLFRVRGSQVSAAEPEQARATAWFWHATVVATVATWYTVVVLK